MFQVSIHPSSVNFQVRYYESPYLVYHEKVKTTKVSSTSNNYIDDIIYNFEL